MRVVAISPVQAREDRIEAAAAVLRGGGIVALPTETFYGFAVDPFQPAALRRLNRLKGREEDSPVLLLLADVGQADQVVANPSERFRELAAMFWPGPLTLVVPACEDLPVEVSGGRGTVGVRVPGLSVPRLLAGALGKPISGVSANRHGDAPCRTAREVVEAFPDGLDLVLDGGPSTGGLPSTVLDLTGKRPRILRPGAVPVSALRPYLSDLENSTV